MSEKRQESARLFKEASKVLPGGVNSPVRAFRGVGGNPIFVERGSGPHFWDADGNRYIDYVLSWGPLILGHTHPAVVEAITKQLQKGSTYGAPTALETELAEMVIGAIPSIEMIRFVSSGTEATMSALRLARAYTGRNKILKFAGCYHGHADFLLVQAGSGVATLGLPDSPGVTAAATADTLNVPYNNLAAVEQVFAENKGQIAAIIVEPVAGNMGMVLPKLEFLQGIRRITEQEGALLIFDEVMTGFRIGGKSGAQGRFGITPDLTTLGKVIGGGLPVGAYGGKLEIMKQIAPLGAVYQAGTLSGNPLAMAAGIATLKELFKPGFYETIEERGKLLDAGMEAALKNSPVPGQFKRIDSKFGLFFTAQEVVDYESAKTSDTKAYASFFWNLVDRGVYFAPSQFEAGFMSIAHTPEIIEETLAAVRESLAALAVAV